MGVMYQVVFISFLCISASWGYSYVKNNRRINIYRNSPPLEFNVFMANAYWGCYIHNPPEVFHGGILNRTCFGTDNSSAYPIPAVWIGDKCINLTDTNYPAIENAIKDSFQSSHHFHRWKECSGNAVRFASDYYTPSDDELTMNCPRVWDGWSEVWSTKFGKTVMFRCPSFIYTGAEPRCQHYAYKECFKNGTWNDNTDYSTCAISHYLIPRTVWHIVWLSIAIAFCVTALIVLFSFDALQSQKFRMISNLLLAITLRSALVIYIKLSILMEELTSSSLDTQMARNGLGCRLLVTIEKIAANAIFACCLLEGIFLVRHLTFIFRSRHFGGIKMKRYYVGATVISIVPALIWAIAMEANDIGNCFISTEDTGYHWINDVVRLAVIIVNTLFLGYIATVVWRTLGKRVIVRYPAIKTTKAALFCMPVFGAPFVLTMFRPHDRYCLSEQTYYFISYMIEGLQGISIAVFHCFLDQEVRKCVSKSIDNLRSRIGASQHFPRSQRMSSSDSRTAVSTEP